MSIASCVILDPVDSRRLTAQRAAALLAPYLTGRPIYRSLANGLRRLMADGRILAGTRLPSERELTSVLGVSRTTVTRAYTDLRDSGHLISRQGAAGIASLPGATTQPGGLRTDSSRLAASRGAGEPGRGGTGDVISLVSAAPPAAAEVATAYRAAMEELPLHLAGPGYEPNGLPELRELLALRYTQAGAPTSADQIIITAGALAAIGLIARTLLDPGDRVLLESPGYPNSIVALGRAGARLLGTPVTAAGWDVTGIEVLLRQAAPRLVLLVPDFQNPTGAVMSASGRERICTVLARTRTVCVVDETLRDMMLDLVTPPPPMASFGGDVYTVGSASKSHWGGMRIGWIRTPAGQAATLAAARLGLDLGAPVLEQLALVQLLRAGTELPTERRSALRNRRNVAAKAIARQLPEWEFALPLGGLSLWCRLPEPLATPLTVAAEREGVLIAPGSSFAVEGGLEHHVRIPFTQDEATLEEGITRLAAAWRSVRQAPAAHAARTGFVA